jgi:hypothetical protein
MTAQPLPGCYPLFLSGLTDDDALALWREFISGERSGTSEQLLPLFNAFGNYPLLVRALAGRVAGYRPAPGDYDHWRKDHPNFNPAAELDLRNAKTHVLHYALEGLGEAQRQVLHTVAAFRMPATWDTLRAVLMGEDKPCRDDRALDDVLTELEDRGLVGWDRGVNRYDLHPLVRGVVWGGVGNEARQGVYRELRTYFNAIPKPPHWKQVASIEDLTSAIELFYVLIGLGRFDDAWHIFKSHLFQALQFRLSLTRRQVELLTLLFPDGISQLPYISGETNQLLAIRSMAEALHRYGQPEQSIELYYRCIHQTAHGSYRLLSHHQMVSDALYLIGRLVESVRMASNALLDARETDDVWHEAILLGRLGNVMAIIGEHQSGHLSLRRSMRMFEVTNRLARIGYGNALLAQLELWRKDTSVARAYSELAACRKKGK